MISPQPSKGYASHHPKITVAVITLSDRSHRGERTDASGPLMAQLVNAHASYQVVETLLLPDDQETLRGELIRLSDQVGVNLVLTTGGTGFSPRDTTPEATLAVGERLAPGIAEAIRAYSLNITPTAMLSRAAAVIRGQTVMVNLPGSPKAVAEILDYLLSPLSHGIGTLLGREDG